MDPLRSFNGDIHTKEALLEFIHDFFNERALSKLYACSDVSYFPEARKIIDEAFEALEERYGIKPPLPDQTNQSR
jgi:hypothetical protein